MTGKKPKIIAFLSGKGGSGKTSTAIAITKLLSEMGYSCLLVDFDLATNGGSYFFQERLGRGDKGIWERLAQLEPNEDVPLGARERGEIRPIGVDDLIIRVNEKFHFVASRVNLKTKGKSYDSVPFRLSQLKGGILSPLLEWAKKRDTDYVLIDCQAGFTLPSAAAAEVADLAVVVTEPDSISSDAAENLLVQLGDSLPNERRYLVNMIDVRDAETYRGMRNVFHSMNRLPPLPFDFAVRNAFGTRQIPIDLGKPSPFLFALFDTIKYMLPEVAEKLDAYKSDHVDALFEEYDARLQRLLAEKSGLEEQRYEIREREIVSRYRIYRNVAALILVWVTTAAGFFAARAVAPGQLGAFSLLPYLLVGLTGTVVLVWYTTTILRDLAAGRIQREGMEERLSRRIAEIEKDTDYFRSLLWAKSREYLVDAEIVREAERMRRGERSL